MNVVGKSTMVGEGRENGGDGERRHRPTSVRSEGLGRFVESAGLCGRAWPPGRYSTYKTNNFSDVLSKIAVIIRKFIITKNSRSSFLFFLFFSLFLELSVFLSEDRVLNPSLADWGLLSQV